MFVLLLFVLSEKFKKLCVRPLENESHDLRNSCVECITELCYFSICIQEVVEFHL